MDMLRFDEFTIGYAWRSDFGSAKASEEQFETLRGYSPVSDELRWADGRRFPLAGLSFLLLCFFFSNIYLGAAGTAQRDPGIHSFSTHNDGSCFFFFFVTEIAGQLGQWEVQDRLAIFLHTCTPPETSQLDGKKDRRTKRSEQKQIGRYMHLTLPTVCTAFQSCCGVLLRLGFHSRCSIVGFYTQSLH